MRLPLISPDQLTPEQKALYERNREQIAHGFTAFKTTTEDGALLGPWGVFLHEPAVGQGALRPDRRGHGTQAAARNRQASGDSGHGRTLQGGVRTLRACGDRREGRHEPPRRSPPSPPVSVPPDLTPEEAAAYDVASALLAGGVLPGATYRAARERLGQDALIELVFWVGLYAQVSITLNAFDVPSEEQF